MTCLFISDLHLAPERPDITDQFETFLRGWHGQAQRLYILGDLFEVWLGDDMGDAFGARIIAALRDIHEAGTEIALMHGNRDFLLGHSFADACGATLLPDPVVQQIHGRRVLLSHGDLLCVDDHDYQRMRRMFRRGFVQRMFLALPRVARNRIARRLRERSATLTRTKLPDIMDVNATAVIRTMQAYDVDCLLHGHTHRPAVHAVDIDGRTATRIVLGDWYTQGSVLVWDAGGFVLHSLVRTQATPNGSETANPAP